MKNNRVLHLSNRCLLCNNAPCTLAAGKGDPARAVRAIRFGNIDFAGQWFQGADLEKAEQACIHPDGPVKLREIAEALPEARVLKDAPSLAIDFCGLHCENPFFLASSAVCTNYEMVASAFRAGWAGVFYKTICLQEINEVSPRFDAVRQSNNSFSGFRNMEQLSENPVEEDFDILHRLKKDFPTKIVVASIMGQTEEEWIKLAKMAEAAGVDAVELNFSCPQMRLAGMGSDVGQSAELVTFLTGYVKRAVSIPVIPKMTPNVASLTQIAMGAKMAGADGISAINTIKSVTIHKDAFVSGKFCISGYSGAAVKPIALRFIVSMALNPFLKDVNLSGIGGINTWRDALEFIQLGCHNVQVCTSVMENGYRIIDDLILGLQGYLASRSVDSLEQLVGERLKDFSKVSDMDRDTKVFPVIDKSKCIGCGRCYISCSDGGHQAITFGDERKPKVVGTKCVGCGLCSLVCPCGAISLSKRVPKISLA